MIIFHSHKFPVFLILTNGSNDDNHFNSFLFFLGLTKLMVFGGVPRSQTIEVLDLADPNVTCQNIPDFPQPASCGFKFSLGGLIPHCCHYRVFEGAVRESDCLCSDFDTNLGRWAGSHLTINSTGCKINSHSWEGYRIVNLYRKPPQVFFDGKTRELESVPTFLGERCLVSINETFWLSVGGSAGIKYTNKTFFYDFGKTVWFAGPELPQNLLVFSCAVFDWHNPTKNLSEKVVIVSANPFVVWRLYLDDLSSGWQMGPDVPDGALFSALVNYRDRILLVGGIEPTLYQLTSPTGPFFKTELKLKNSWLYAKAALIPDEVTVCH